MEQQINCEGCGAGLTYKPGTKGLTCHYCGHAMSFESPDTTEQAHEELDLEYYLDHFEEDHGEIVERRIVKCGGCGAETSFEENQQSGACPFCDSPITIKQSHIKKAIKPRGLLPFAIERKQAQTNFRAWLKKLWFAPNALKKQITQLDKFKGVYLPFWTYDCDTLSSYVGQRGTYYYVTVTSRGKNGQTISRRERKTRWRMVSGKVSCVFDDILVPASKSLPDDKLCDLEPWDLDALVDYRDEYLSGYVAETYQVSLRQGYGAAKKTMDARIVARVRRDIGGDEQRVFSVDTHYSSATFKHILLPVWTSTYRYREKLYQILVNARTGEVQAQRPWSWVKITLAILAVLALIGGGYLLSKSTTQEPAAVSEIYTQ